MIERSFTFSDRMKMSEGLAHNQDIPDIIHSCFPNAVKVEKADSSDDRNGTDYWVTLPSGHKVSVDIKAREVDFGFDDVALETWSVIENKVVGWARDIEKRTDYILCYWYDSGRWMLFPFPMLCSVFCEHWEIWKKKYKGATQKTVGHGRKDYHSECVFVPRRIIWNEIYVKFSGGIVCLPTKAPRYRGGLPDGGYLAQLTEEERTIIQGFPDMEEA